MAEEKSAVDEKELGQEAADAQGADRTPGQEPIADEVEEALEQEPIDPSLIQELKAAEADFRAAEKAHLQAKKEAEKAAEQARLEVAAALRRTEEARAAAEREVAKRQRAEAEAASLRQRNEALRSAQNAAAAAAGGGKNASDLEAEVDELRRARLCSVCVSRQKDTCIVKCMHVFCGECVRSRLDTRARKCPGCSLSFAASDVKAIYLD